ncbi:MAG: DEAD/DEAH box helicase, partial [Spirochaetales bacterium]
MTSVYLEVFLNLPLPSSFFYVHNHVSEDTPACLGMRIEVPFRNRKMTAFVVHTYDRVPPAVDFPVEKIKPVLRIIDKEPIFTEEQVKLALWMEKYYICSRGEALSTMLPSGRREKETAVFSFSDDVAEYTQHTLSDEQTTAIEGILAQADTASGMHTNMHYLYGSTGSGKTEVFLHVAQKKLAEQKGIIYLVPEIGLTHQVTEAVVRRFGDTVAILHSGLTGSQRLEQHKRILNRQARVVVGARSAVFAPVPDLGLIII